MPQHLPKRHSQGVASVVGGAPPPGFPAKNSPLGGPTPPTGIDILSPGPPRKIFW